MDVHDKKTQSYNMSRIKWKNIKPEEMFEYIKNLPEFDEEVWAKITGK